MKALLVWELGSDLGHISNLATVARVLTDLGYQVSCCFSDTRGAKHFMSGMKVRFVPFPSGRIRDQVAAVESLVDIFMARDFGHPDLLAKQVRKWQAVYESLKPDLVVFDYAPTAMFAARSYRFRKAVLGNGWTVPPPGHGVVPLNLWRYMDQAELAQREAALVNSINQVGRRFGMPDVSFIGDLFAADQTLIYDFPALDIYESMRQEGIYLGPIHEESWPLPVKDIQASDRSVFAYLKPAYPVTWRVLEALKQIDAEKYIFCPTEAEAVRLGTDKRFRVFDRPVNLKRLMPKMNVAICHAGAGTMGRAILANTPLLTLPLQLEQANKAELYRRTGAGLSAAPDASVEELVLKIQQLCDEPVYRERTTSLAATVDTTLSARTRLWHTLRTLAVQSASAGHNRYTLWPI